MLAAVGLRAVDIGPLAEFQHLDSHEAVDLRIVTEIDHAEGSATQLALNAEAVDRRRLCKGGRGRRLRSGFVGLESLCLSNGIKGVSEVCRKLPV